MPLTDAQREADCSRWEYEDRKRRKLAVVPVDDAWTDADDGDYYDGDIGPELQRYLDLNTWGRFDYNEDGRHVLHQLAEDFRSERTTFSMSLWMQAQWATYSLLPEGLHTRTNGTRPVRATERAAGGDGSFIAAGTSAGCSSCRGPLASDAEDADDEYDDAVRHSS